MSVSGDGGNGEDCGYPDGGSWCQDDGGSLWQRGFGFRSYDGTDGLGPFSLFALVPRGSPGRVPLRGRACRRPASRWVRLRASGERRHSPCPRYEMRSPVSADDPAFSPGCERGRGWCCPSLRRLAGRPLELRSVELVPLDSLRTSSVQTASWPEQLVVTGRSTVTGSLS